MARLHDGVVTDPTPHDGLALGGYPIVLPKIRDPRLRLTVVTVTIHILGQVAFGFNLSIAQILISLISAGSIEFIYRLRTERVIAWPASALLSGNGVALILRVPGTQHGDWWSFNGWYIFAGVSFGAVASKYLIRRRGSHVFNPSNLALVVAFVVLGEQRVDPQILWWGSWSIPIALAFAVIIAGSLVITLSVRQMGTALSFWVAFALLVGANAASGHAITTNWHVGPLQGWSYWLTLVTSPEVLIFLFFMITDPKTSPNTDRGKIIFGSSIAVVSAIIISTQTGEFGTKVGILAGLVILCPFVPMINRVTSVTSDELTRHGLRSLRVAGIAVVVALIPVYFIGAARSVDTGTPSPSTHNMDRRHEFETLRADLPQITLDDQAAHSAFELTPELATRIGHDVAIGLTIEATAIAQQDLDLPSAALALPRLQEVTKGIRAARKGRIVAPNNTFRFDTITVTLFKPDSGPQTPPELAVRIKGAVLGKRVEAFDHWFTVTEVTTDKTNQDSVYLVNAEYDQKRQVVPPRVNQTAGQQGSGGDIEAVVTEATPEELGGLRLVDRAGELGVNLPHSRYDLGEGQDYRIGGAAVGDFNNDGRADIFLTRVGYRDVLYRNDGGHFTDVTKEAGISDHDAMEPIDEGSTAATFVDIDGDGDLDLVTLGQPGTPNRLFIGNGMGSFEDRGSEWHFPQTTASIRTASSGTSLYVGLATADFDRDGNVDLMVVSSEPGRIARTFKRNKVSSNKVCDPRAQALLTELDPVPSNTRLLRNTGHSFEDATISLGVDPSRIAATAARFMDLNDDGWDDLVIPGEACTTKALINDSGVFTDQTAALGLGKISRSSSVTPMRLRSSASPNKSILGLFSVGASAGELGSDCRSVITVVGCSGNRLVVGEDSSNFIDQSKPFQVGITGWFWGAVAADLNNDSYDDLLLTSGIRNVKTWLNEFKPEQRDNSWTHGSLHLWVGASDAPLRKTASEAVFNQIQTDDQTTQSSPAERYTGRFHNSRAAVEADFNNDGRLDLLVVNNGSLPALFTNETVNSNHWVSFELEDMESANRYGIGSLVTVEFEDGSSLSQRIGTERSYQGSGTSTAHFGLGVRPSIRSAQVRWTDGLIETLKLQSVNTMVKVKRGQS